MQMRRLLPLAAVLLALAAAPPAAGQPCNTEDGNIEYCVNYNAVGYGEISVCNQAENVEPAAVLYAMNAWNSMIGKSLFTSGCPPYSGIVIVDREEGFCGYMPDGSPYWACTLYPGQEGPVFLPIYVTPIVGVQTLTLQKSVIGHEMGHDLGFAHWDTDPAVSIMHPFALAFTDPQPVDADNYEKAYWVEAVTNLSGSAPSPGAVSLTWNPVNSAGEELCNEKEFSVWRWNPSTAWYDIYVATGGQDSTGVSFGGQPYCVQWYAVWSMTEARSSSFGGYGEIPVAVRGSGGDSDGDDFADWVEVCIGTDPYDDCPNVVGSHDAWPLDINMDRLITLCGDVVNYIGHVGATVGDPNWWHRLDLNADGVINLGGDAFMFTAMIGETCE
jgi:hypothetical protein